MDTDQILIALVTMSNLLGLGHSAKHIAYKFEEAKKEVKELRQSADDTR